MHLRYSIMTASIDCKENRHPQTVMEELGITYQHSTPQSIADQWWFWNCENVPATLPKFLEELNVKPYDVIGYGLSKEMADQILGINPGTDGDAYLFFGNAIPMLDTPSWWRKHESS